MIQHRFSTPSVVEVADPRVLRSGSLARRQTIRTPFDMPPDDWASFPSNPATCGGRVGSRQHVTTALAG